MINLVLASLVLSGPSVDSTPAEAPPLKIWINNNRGFRPGEAVKVQVETGKTGYLLVLHFSPAGQLSVLFPVSPGDDALVQAGRRYEVRDPDGSVSFVASGSGPGLIYSAISEDPWQLEGVNLSGAWDYGALTIARDTKDPEADLTALVQRLSTSRGFDYDVLDYAVFGDRGGDASPPPSWWSPTYSAGYGDGCYCGYGPSAIYIGFGFNWGYAGWPWAWGYWPYASHYGYRYGYGYGYGYGYYPGYGHGYPYYPYYPGYGHGQGGYYPYNKIVGRPRGYRVNPAGVTPDGRGRGGSRRESVVTSGEGVFADANAPARRARGGSDRGNDRASRGGVGRPVENSGTRAGGEGTRAGDTGTRSNGGDRGDRARPRDGGSRGRASGRSGYSTTMTTPNVETARPVSRARGEWVRVDATTSKAPARRAESPVRQSTGTATRVDLPQARRTYRPEAPRTREVFAARPSSGGEARSDARTPTREAPRTEARPGGGNRSANTPSYAAPRSNGGQGARSAPRAQGGGGGGRARGRP